MSETSITDVTIINRALARVGAPGIFALDEETSIARQAVAVYFDRRDACLGLYPWSFAKMTYKLDRLTEEPLNGWRFAYALPGNRLSAPLKVLTDPQRPDYPLRRFTVEANAIYCDEEAVWATVIVQAAPAVWSPAFRLAVTTLVAADLAVPVGHDTALADDLRTQGEGTPSEGGRGGMLGRALIADASGAPTPAPLLAADPLTTAHMS